MKHCLYLKFVNRRHFFFFRFLGERGRAQGEREVRDTRDERGAKKILPARVSRTSRSPRACPRSPEKRKKITPVLQAEITTTTTKQMIRRKVFHIKNRCNHLQTATRNAGSFSFLPSYPNKHERTNVSQLESLRLDFLSPFLTLLLFLGANITAAIQLFWSPAITFCLK